MSKNESADRIISFLRRVSDGINKLASNGDPRVVAELRLLMTGLIQHSQELARDFGKFAPVDSDRLAKGAPDIFAKAVGDMTTTLSEVLTYVKEIHAQPVPAGPVPANVVHKRNDDGTGLDIGPEDISEKIDALSPDDRAMLFVKFAQRNPLLFQLQPK